MHQEVQSIVFKSISISQNKHRPNVLHNELTHKEMAAVAH
jgi:hypothetical protein